MSKPKSQNRKYKVIISKAKSKLSRANYNDKEKITTRNIIILLQAIANHNS